MKFGVWNIILESSKIHVERSVQLSAISLRSSPVQLQLLM